MTSWTFEAWYILDKVVNSTYVLARDYIELSYQHLFEFAQDRRINFVSSVVNTHEHFISVKNINGETLLWEHIWTKTCVWRSNIRYTQIKQSEQHGANDQTLRMFPYCSEISHTFHMNTHHFHDNKLKTHCGKIPIEKW